MKFIKTNIEGLVVIEPDILEDQRGYFFESFRQDELKANGVLADFIQENESKSTRGVLRGLHFQHPPHAQAKLVRVVKGAVLDVAVDIRKGSPTYGKWEAVRLNEDNKRMVFIPTGFAHGFLTLAEDTIFQYKCTRYYNNASEGAIRWNDPQLGIDWGIDDPVISEKDSHATLFADFNSPF